jgi:DNA-binding NtrC family response regulator
MASEEFKADILLVDAEENFLKVLSQRLETRGLTVDTVTSGEEALEKVKGKNYNVVILDLVMPGMGGIEVLKNIRKDYPYIQVIILTGQGTTDKAVEAMREGAMDFMDKPADIDILVKKIMEARHRRLLLLTESAQEII